METTGNTKTTWTIDPAHSKVGFKIRHLMISNVLGHFNEFEGTLQTVGNDFTSGEISFSMKTSSIDTGVADRDAHLKSADFFDAEVHPLITFKSTKVKNMGDEKYELTGDLTIRGISHPITVSAEFGGVMTDPWGHVKAGFNIEGKLNRKDWGLNWNAALEAGGVVVGEDVKINCDIELLKSTN